MDATIFSSVPSSKFQCIPNTGIQSVIMFITVYLAVQCTGVFIPSIALSFQVYDPFSTIVSNRTVAVHLCIVYKDKHSLISILDLFHALFCSLILLELLNCI